MINKPTKILIVEDNPALGQTLLDFLDDLNFAPYWADSSIKAEALFYKEHPSIILMDIGLPDGNGLELAKQWRMERQDFVLLFISAWNDPETRLEGLELGAEDYITKPFALKELELRLKRILRFQKQQLELADEIKIGPLTIWFKKYQVQNAQGKIISLSQKECQILELLYRNKEQVIEREEIILQVWGDGAYTSARTVDNYIVNLRKWCDSDPNKNLQITSVRGVGYKLTIKTT